jgi:hypothetical protein
VRIAPLAPPYPADVQAQFDQLPLSWQPPLEHFTVLARDPRLLRAYRQGSVAYLNPSHLSIRQREVFLLRVTGRCRNAFEWCLRVHYFADEAAVNESQLHASVYANADDACWQAGDRVLVRLADDFMTPPRSAMRSGPRRARYFRKKRCSSSSCWPAITAPMRMCRLLCRCRSIRASSGHFPRRKTILHGRAVLSALRDRVARATI